MLYINNLLIYIESSSGTIYTSPDTSSSIAKLLDLRRLPICFVAEGFVAEGVSMFQAGRKILRCDLHNHRCKNGGNWVEIANTDVDLLRPDHSRRSLLRRIPVRLCPAALIALSLLSSVAASAQTTPAKQIEGLKASLAASAAALRSYEWIETTTASVKGEVRGSTQTRNYYGADGKLQKVPVSAPAVEKAKRGLRGKIIANKKAEIEEYLKAAKALMANYVPPSPEKMQAAVAAGNVNVGVSSANAPVPITIKNYQKAGDQLVLTVDGSYTQLKNVSVSSYLDTPDDKITLTIKMAQLPDGTGYVATSMLDAPAKDVSIQIANSGHRKAN